jgi:hypothetical protein
MQFWHYGTRIEQQYLRQCVQAFGNAVREVKWELSDYSFEQRYITITTEPANAKGTLLQPFGQPPVSLGRTPLNSTPVAVMSKLKVVKNIRFSPQAYTTYLNNAVVRIELDGYESFYGALKTDKEETLEHHIILQPLSK